MTSTRAADVDDHPSTVEPAESTATDTVEAPRVVTVRELVEFLRPVRGRIAVCALLSAGGAAAGMVTFIALAEVARTVVHNGVDAGRNAVWLWISVAAVSVVARLVLLELSSNLGHHADAVMLRHLRGRIVEHMGVVPLGWVRSMGSGRIKKALTDDLEALHLLIGHVVGQLAAGVVALVIGLGYLAFVHVPMTLVTAAVPALALLSYLVAMRSMPGHVSRLVAADARIGAASVEYGDGIAVIKTFGAGGRVLAGFRAAVGDYVDAFRVWVRQTRFSSAFALLFGLPVTTLVVALAVGLVFTYAGGLAFVDLLAFVLVGVALPTSLMPVVSAAQELRNCRMAVGNIDALLSVEQLPTPATPSVPDGSRIELDHLTYSYDGTTDVLRGIDAVFEPGTITALVGPSGAGKSTLASLLPRFDDVTGGAIRIGGVDIREIAPEQLLSMLALVFQDVVLVRDTVAENIRLGCPGADDETVRRAARTAGIHEVIEGLPHGYDTVLGADHTDLSGGERQRLSIARSLLADAPIVVLDEATSALDPDSEAAVQEAIAQVIANKTVIVIAHRLHTIVDADQILVLDEGEVAERGRHDDLVNAGGLYARLWSAQHGEDR